MTAAAPPQSADSLIESTRLLAESIIHGTEGKKHLRTTLEGVKSAFDLERSLDEFREVAEHAVRIGKWKKGAKKSRVHEYKKVLQTWLDKSDPNNALFRKAIRAESLHVQAAYLLAARFDHTDPAEVIARKAAVYERRLFSLVEFCQREGLDKEMRGLQRLLAETTSSQ